ncbi:hypothetical protein [Actinomadura harenae]|uniref:Uncharacterized protein n=1 Tax=Actinomadura harenae TaxID=2483351 RepID=A0A3M2M8C2_9ACTN|nr:hypothetical protein [Actinomadura harenae]RMI45083.1 hypothetical protein EBO15_10970 [Actinomadura harenae]
MRRPAKIALATALLTVLPPPLAAHGNSHPLSTPFTIPAPHPPTGPPTRTPADRPAHTHTGPPVHALAYTGPPTRSPVGSPVHDPVSGAAERRAGAPVTYVLDDSGKQLIQPRELALDEFTVAGDLRWHRWGGRTAVADARVDALWCTPDCEHGTPSTLTLSAPAQHSGALYYSRATLTSPHFPSGPHTLTLQTPHP